MGQKSEVKYRKAIESVGKKYEVRSEERSTFCCSGMGDPGLVKVMASLTDLCLVALKLNCVRTCSRPVIEHSIA